MDLGVDAVNQILTKIEVLLNKMGEKLFQGQVTWARNNKVLTSK